MPSPRELPPVPPRELADLPYASHLEPFGGRLAREGDYDTVHLDGNDFEGIDGGGARFLESAFSAVTFTGGSYRRARLNDVWLHTVRWVGSDLAETDWLDAEVIASALAGLEMFGAAMRRVTFHNCKFDSVNARGTTLREIAFVGCVLRDVDFSGATLADVAFPGSTLEGVRLENARMSAVDLRGAVALGITIGSDGLGGATISHPQLLDLAPLFAQVLGVTVSDG